LSLQNVTWIQSGNYSFTIGAIEVVDKLCLKGNSTFAYQSAQTSTVWANGKIVVDRGMTFSFDPIYNSNYSLTHDIAGTAINRWDWARDFLCFEDGTAALELKGSTLHVTSTGLKIKKGTFRVREKSYITSELDGDFHIEEGFILGNNSSSDDARCEIDGGAILEVTSGAFSYKNMQSTSWLMFNDQSKLSIANGGKLKLHQTLDVGDGIASFADGGRLARASGKSLEGSVHILGSVYYEICYN